MLQNELESDAARFFYPGIEPVLQQIRLLKPFVARQVWTRVVKRATSLTTRFAAMLQDKSVARFYCPFHRTPVAFVDDEYWLSINLGGEVTPPKYLYGYVPPKGY